MLLHKSILAAVVTTLTCTFVFAADRGQGRLFLGSTQISPKQANDALDTTGMAKLDMHNQLGLEITLPLLKFAQAGFRYTHRPTREEEATANDTTDYYTELNQQVFAGVLRAPLVNRDVFKFDVVLGAGLTSTELKLKSAGLEGSLDKKGYSSPMALAGLSFAVGYKKFYFVIEGGYEHNKVSGLKESNITSTVKELDLSGSYLTVGLLFDDVPVFTK